MYEVQCRSVSEHEQFSFRLERENIKFLTRANNNFIKEIERQNDVEELVDHSYLGL